MVLQRNKTKDIAQVHSTNHQKQNSVTRTRPQK